MSLVGIKWSILIFLCIPIVHICYLRKLLLNYFEFKTHLTQTEVDSEVPSCLTLPKFFSKIFFHKEGVHFLKLREVIEWEKWNLWHCFYFSFFKSGLPIFLAVTELSFVFQVVKFVVGYCQVLQFLVNIENTLKTKIFFTFKVMNRAWIQIFFLLPFYQKLSDFTAFIAVEKKSCF